MSTVSSTVRALIAGLIVVFVLGAAVSPAAAEHEQNDGIDPATGMYVSVQFTYLLDWEEPWEVDREQTVSNSGESDLLTLVDGVGKFVLLGFLTESTPEEVLDFTVGRYSDQYPSLEVVGEDAEAGIPNVTLSYEDDNGPALTYLEIQEVPGVDGSGTFPLLVSLDAGADAFVEEWESANELITRDPLGMLGTPLFLGTPQVEGISGGSQDAGDDDDDQPRGNAAGVDGDTYTSPTYGYALTLSGEWEFDGEESADEVDVVALTNGTSELTLTGSATARNARDCIDTAVEELLSERAFRDFEQAAFSDGEPYEGDGPFGPFVGYTDGETAVYLECMEIADGDAFVVARFVTPLESFGDEFSSYEELLTGLDLEPRASGDDEEADDEQTTGEDGGSDEAAGDEDAPTDDDDDSAEPGGVNTFEDETLGWSIAWSDDWSVTNEVETDGFLGLSSEATSVFVSSIEDYDGDAAACVRDQVALLADSEGVSGVTGQRFDGEVIKGGDETASMAGYRYTFKVDNTTIKMVAIYDCRTLVEGETVLLTSVVVPLDNFKDEYPAIQELLESITVPGGNAPASEDDEEEDAA